MIRGPEIKLSPTILFTFWVSGYLVLVKLGRNKVLPKSGSGDADPFFATLKRLHKQQIRAAADTNDVAEGG